MTDAASLPEPDPGKADGPARTSQARGPLGALYNWMVGLAAGRSAEPALCVVSFAESSFFPLPPDVMLAPMCYARPQRAWRFAFLCTLASVLGAGLGYAIGFYVFEAVGQPILAFLGYAGREGELKALYDQWGLMATLIAAFTPIPFKLVTIVSGMLGYAFIPFILASIVARGARFFLVAWLFKTFGPALAPVIERRIGLFSLIFVIVLVGAFVAVRFIH